LAKASTTPLPLKYAKSLDFIAKNLNRVKENGGTTLLIVEHRVKECLKIANSVIGMKLGKVFSEIDVTTTFDTIMLNSIFF
jgi:ABC-type branched-subunit amino acid transport system ATPase component